MTPPPTDENAGQPCPECGGVRPWCNLTDRIQNYLGNGGLFNPEMMDHGKVRDLLVDIRDAIQPLSVKPSPPASEAGAQTPRTDEDEFNGGQGIGMVVSSERSRRLEIALATATRELEETEKYLSSRQILRTGDGTFSAVDQSVINLVERLESDLAEARRQGQEMRKELENTRAEIALEKDVLELAQQKSWRHFREDMQAMQYRMVTQLHNIDAALATPSPQGNNEDKKP